MNANATTGIRELTAQELDQVTGGATISAGDAGDGVLVWASLSVALGCAVALGNALWDWLFG